MKKPVSQNTISVLSIALAIMVGVLLLSIQSYNHVKNSTAKGAESDQITLQEFTALEIKNKIDQNENFFLIDTRSKSDFSQEHIEKSISITANEVELKHTQLLPADQLIVLTCENDSCQSLEEVMTKLTALGFNNLGYLSGGVDSWESFGYPLTSASGRTADELYSLSASELNAKIVSEDPVDIIDVRPRDEYLKSHIINARNIPFDQINSNIKSLRPDREIILYSNQADLSSLVFKSLAEKGFKNLFILEGGFNTWTQGQFQTDEK